MIQLHACDFGRDPEQGQDLRTAREIERFEDDSAQMRALRSWDQARRKDRRYGFRDMAVGAVLGVLLALAFVLAVTR